MRTVQLLLVALVGIAALDVPTNGTLTDLTEEPNGKCYDCFKDYCGVEYKQGPDACNKCIEGFKKKFRDKGKCGDDCFTRSQERCKGAPVPGPKPPGPGQGCSSWPSFASADALKASPWGAYMTNVYGSLPTSYPFDVKSLWLLYDAEIAKAEVQAPSPTTCPAAQCDRYTLNDDYQPPKVSWIWHDYPYDALPAHQNVEVIHDQDPFGDETVGAWMLVTPGSGIYFNTGRTIVFAEHSDAYAHFNIPAGNDMNSAVSAAAAKAGYDSMQFTAHVDHVSYQCDTKNTGRPGFDYMGLEIVDVRASGKFACMHDAGGQRYIYPQSVTRGWGGNADCKCDSSLQFLNCDGVPYMRSNATARPRL